MSTLPKPNPILAYAVPAGIFLLCWLLTFTAKCTAQPTLMSTAIMIDLMITAPLVYYLAIRKTRVPGFTTLRVAVVGLLVAGWILGAQPKLAADLGGLVLRRGETVPVRVMAFRRDGFAGDIVLSLVHPPPGLSLGSEVLEAGKSTDVVFLTAAPDAPAPLPGNGAAGLRPVPSPHGVVDPRREPRDEPEGVLRSPPVGLGGARFGSARTEGRKGFRASGRGRGSGPHPRPSLSGPEPRNPWCDRLVG